MKNIIIINAQAAALESIMTGGRAKRILGCSSRTCNETVRGDMGLDSLQGRRDEMVATMPEHRYFCAGVECQAT